jgi:hypothetical protein
MGCVAVSGHFSAAWLKKHFLVLLFLGSAFFDDSWQVCINLQN